VERPEEIKRAYAVFKVPSTDGRIEATANAAACVVDLWRLPRARPSAIRIMLAEPSEKDEVAWPLPNCGKTLR
jgi:hypothetical protein